MWVSQFSPVLVRRLDEMWVSQFSSQFSSSVLVSSRKQTPAFGNAMSGVFLSITTAHSGGSIFTFAVPDSTNPSCRAAAPETSMSRLCE